MVGYELLIIQVLNGMDLGVGVLEEAAGKVDDGRENNDVRHDALREHWHCGQLLAHAINVHRQI